MSPKPNRPQYVFVVEHTERLTPHLVRVHLGGPAFDAFVSGADPERLGATDRYVKLLLARPGLGLEPPFDLDALRRELPKADLPVRRTYTVRSVDRHAGTIAVDFVVHGEDGIAGPWAASARPGDRLALSGPGGGYAPSPDPSVTHLLFGDDSAIPAIASALEAMDASAAGLALIEVAGPDDELPLRRPDGVELRWLHRGAPVDPGSAMTVHPSDRGGTPSDETGTQDGGAEPGRALTEAVRALPRASRPVQVFAHGERSAMKAIRRVLQDDWGLERADMSLSAYWAAGRAEDRFQEEKREPVGVIFVD